MVPKRRLRRLRKSDGMRRLIRESRVGPDDLVCPIIVGEGISEPQRTAMPGIQRIPPDMVGEEISKIHDMGIPAVMLFGIPATKDHTGTVAHSEDGVIQNAIRAARRSVPEMTIMADVCMCQYTHAGHCGIVKDGHVDNDTTIQCLARIALSYARSGVDIVSPSSMMDGQVGVIRRALDDAGHDDTVIMSQTAKHHSSLYSPFRDAAYCAPKFGDRREYQVPYTNRREAMREVASDIEEGVDMIMIKPAMSYLDVVAEAKRRFAIPVAAYSVSGEYAMVQAAHSMGWLDGPQATLEVLSCIKRAGADMIITYSAKDVAALLG